MPACGGIHLGPIPYGFVIYACMCGRSLGAHPLISSTRLRAGMPSGIVSSQSFEKSGKVLKSPYQTGLVY